MAQRVAPFDVDGAIARAAWHCWEGAAPRRSAVRRADVLAALARAQVGRLRLGLPRECVRQPRRRHRPSAGSRAARPRMAAAAAARPLAERRRPPARPADARRHARGPAPRRVPPPRWPRRRSEPDASRRSLRCPPMRRSRGSRQPPRRCLCPISLGLGASPRLLPIRPPGASARPRALPDSPPAPTGSRRARAPALLPRPSCPTCAQSPCALIRGIPIPASV